MKTQNKGTDKVSKVISLIEYELDNNCNVEVYPEVCRRASDPRQKKQIIQSVVYMIAKNRRMTIDAAIAQLESEYQGLHS